MSVKVKIKLDGKDAKQAAKSIAKEPDASGANYVSDNLLHVAATGKPSERVSYKKVVEAGDTPGAAATERAKNNLQRDQRTNLGKGKSGIVEVEG